MEKKIGKKKTKSAVTATKTDAAVSAVTTIPSNAIFTYLTKLDKDQLPKVIMVTDETGVDPYCVFSFVSNLIDISKKDVRSIEFKDERRQVVITMYD